MSPRTRSVGRSVDQVRQQIDETNGWMAVHGLPDGQHGVGTELAHASEHLQELVRRLDEAYADRDIEADPERGRKVDAVGEQVRKLERQVGRTLAALRLAVGQH